MKEQSEKENKTETEKNINFLVNFVYQGTENLLPEERNLIALARLKEMGFEIPQDVEEKTKKISRSKFLKYLLFGGIGLAGTGIGYLAGDRKPSVETKTEEKKPTAVQPKPAIDFQKVRESKPRFDTATYEKLSSNGKRVYDFVRQKNPTPGKSYVILDKTKMTAYLIDQNNKLTADSCIVAGSDLGEEQNTSVKAKRGTRTTPAGIYVIGKKTGLQEKDAVLYQGKSFTLWGVSIKGDKVFLGWHRTYSDPNDPNEFKNRTEAIKKIAGGTIWNPRKEGALSDGCINSPETYFIEYAQANLKGDGSELMYILPDIDPKTGKEPAFEPAEIIGRIKSIMKEVQKIEKKGRGIVD